MEGRMKYIEFSVPDGLDLSGIEEGEEKEILAVIRKKSEDTACLISVDGIEVAPYSEKSKDPKEDYEEDGYAKYAARAKRSLI